jgi:hypothetical protein
MAQNLWHRITFGPRVTPRGPVDPGASSTTTQRGDLVCRLEGIGLRRSPRQEFAPGSHSLRFGFCRMYSGIGAGDGSRTLDARVRPPRMHQPGQHSPCGDPTRYPAPRPSRTHRWTERLLFQSYNSWVQSGAVSTTPARHKGKPPRVIAETLFPRPLFVIRIRCLSGRDYLRLRDPPMNSPPSNTCNIGMPSFPNP